MLIATPSSIAKPPVCRLAPSPTGAQHLGNARTFLLAYWSARSQDAKLILRVEDIDSPRVKPWATVQAIDDLAWLGIRHDGEPIIQTDRKHLYQRVLDRMIADDRVYPCTCTRTDIENAASAPHDDSLRTSAPNVLPQNDQNIDCNIDRTLVAETTIYPGTCGGWRRGDPMPPAGEFCWRFRITTEPMTLHDRVAGGVTCDPATAVGDFPVTRKGGEAAYQLAVVVDDMDAGVTEVVRGDDLLVSAFRQLQIYEYLAAAVPSHAHVPLVVGSDGRRLAKRHGDTRLSQYREQGVAPETIVAWAARTAFPNDHDLFQESETRRGSLDRWHQEMIERFDWSRLNRNPVVVDAAALG